MDKRCKVCGANVSSKAKFCQSCGSSEFIMDNNDQTIVLNEINSPYWQAPVPQKRPKKSNKGLIIAIIVVVLLVLAGIGSIAEKVFQSQGYGQRSDTILGSDFDNSDNVSPENNYIQSSDVEYTKGEFDGTTYINEWADIKLVLPAGFSNADSSTYSAAENSTTDCGVYFMADDTMSLIYICYEKLPTFPEYDEESYLDSAMNAMESQAPAGITYETTGVYTTTTIAGYAYASVECEFNNGYGDFVQSIYVRKIDNHMVFISAIGVSADTNNNLVKTITTVN